MHDYAVMPEIYVCGEVWTILIEKGTLIKYKRGMMWPDWVDIYMCERSKTDLVFFPEVIKYAQR